MDDEFGPRWMKVKIRPELKSAMLQARKRLQEASFAIELAKQAFESEPVITSTTGLNSQADAAKAVVQQMLGTIALWLREE